MDWLQTILVPVITVALGWLTLIVNNRLKRKEKRETEIQSKKREVLQKYWIYIQKGLQVNG